MVLIFNYFVKTFKNYFLSGLFIQLIIYNLLLIVILNINFNLTLTPNIFWIICLYSILISLNNLFQKDFLDSSLELIYLSKLSLFNYIIIQFILFWCFCQIPFFLIIYLFFLFNFEFLISLILSSLCFTLIGGLINVLTLYAKEQNIILSIMLLPLFIPIIIYGTTFNWFTLLQLFLFLSIFISCITYAVVHWIIK